jgi:hypothetical protein
MIDPPNHGPENPTRKAELDQTVDYAIQLLVEEAHLVGWQRVEFLTAVMDAANARLSALEEERELEQQDGDSGEAGTLTLVEVAARTEDGLMPLGIMNTEQAQDLPDELDVVVSHPAEEADTTKSSDVPFDQAAPRT